MPKSKVVELPDTPRKRTRVLSFSGEGKFHPLTPRLGDQLRRIRKEQGLTTTALARSLKYSQSYVSGMETGHAKPCVAYLGVFAKFFNVDDKQLFLLAGILPPQYQAYIALYPEEAFVFFEGKTKQYQISEAPDTVDFSRLEKI